MNSRFTVRIFSIPVLIIFSAGSGFLYEAQAADYAALTVIVNDPNNVALSGARVFLQPPAAAVPARCDTDYTGQCRFDNLVPGKYDLRVEKENYYLAKQQVDVRNTLTLEISLARQQEVREVVNVVESPPAIDPGQVALREKVSGVDIINIPYSTTRDYRNALNF